MDNIRFKENGEKHEQTKYVTESSPLSKQTLLVSVVIIIHRLNKGGREGRESVSQSGRQSLS